MTSTRLINIGFVSASRSIGRGQSDLESFVHAKSEALDSMILECWADVDGKHSRFDCAERKSHKRLSASLVISNCTSSGLF